MSCRAGLLEICTMNRFTSSAKFLSWFLFFIGGICSNSQLNAQLSFEPQGDLLSSKDSLDVMTQMWHALPEAEVGGIGLAGGASDASEIPGSMQRLSSKTLRQMSYADPIRTLHALAGSTSWQRTGLAFVPTSGCVAPVRNVPPASP